MGVIEPLGLVYIYNWWSVGRGRISQTQISDARTRALAALSQNCGAVAREEDDGVDKPVGCDIDVGVTELEPNCV